MKFSRLGASLALTTALTLSISACAANEAPAPPGGDGEAAVSGTIAGVGSSAMASAQEAWIAAFQTANSGANVSYAPEGSGAGRDALTGGAADFAGSDRAMDADEVAADALASSRCADGSLAINMPVYISPIAVIYNLEGVEELNLDATTTASIFNGTIKTWNDPAIAALNPDANLPSTNITAVHRADDSGTTENFTDYLSVAAPDVWTDEPDGEWPIAGGEAASQTSGVISAVSGGQGTIGYADASRAGELGVARIKVGEEFVEYSPERAANVVEAAKTVEEEGRSENDLALEIDRTATGDVYPIVLVAYAIACEQYENPESAALVKAYLGYIASEEGQQESAAKAGNAPLSAGLSERVAASIESIS